MPTTKLLARFALIIPTCAAVVLLNGCALSPQSLPTSGPTAQDYDRAAAGAAGSVRVVEITEDTARKANTLHRPRLFSDAFPTAKPSAGLLAPGDVVEVSIWEAPPASLFSNALDVRGASSGARAVTLPEQMVDVNGAIDVPFAGTVAVARHTPQEAASAIATRLRGKANQPQVLVRTAHNNTANVTVVGDVAASTRMPLTARGERLLDALAAAGGVRQPVSKMTLQLTRGNTVHSLPLDMVIRDPRQNVVLQPGDVVTSMFQPLSFSVLGATGKNEELSFESQGISLAQALARAGGLQDARADARGVFVFRFEDAEAVDGNARRLPDGRVPVVYRLDLKDPASFFLAQSFPVLDHDILYVSNAPAVELQKFLNIVVSAVYPVANVVSVTR